MNRQKEVSYFYENDAFTYEETRFTSERGRITDMVQRIIVSSLCGDITNKKVLEVGVGTGRFTISMARKGGTVVGVDIATNMLKRLRKKVLKIDPYELALIRADATRLPFRNRTFDYVVCINVLNHLPDFALAICEFARVLEDKAYFIGNFPNLSGFCLPVALFVNKIKRSLINPVFSRWFSLRKVRKTLHNASFRIEVIQGHMGLGVFLPIPSYLNILEDLVRYTWLKYLSSMLFVKAKLILNTSQSSQ